MQMAHKSKAFIRLTSVRAYDFHSVAEDPWKLLTAESEKEKVFQKTCSENASRKKLKHLEQVKLLDGLLQQVASPQVPLYTTFISQTSLRFQKPESYGQSYHT